MGVEGRTGRGRWQFWCGVVRPPGSPSSPPPLALTQSHSLPHFLCVFCRVPAPRGSHGVRRWPVASCGIPDPPLSLGPPFSLWWLEVHGVRVWENPPAHIGGEEEGGFNPPLVIFFFSFVVNCYNHSIPNPKFVNTQCRFGLERSKTGILTKFRKWLNNANNGFEGMSLHQHKNFANN